MKMNFVFTVETPKKDKTDEDDLDDLTSTSSSEEDSEVDYEGEIFCKNYSRPHHKKV